MPKKTETILFSAKERMANMKSNRILMETIIVAAVTLAGMLLLPQFRLLFSLIPITYLLVERRVRNRSWADLGFKFQSFWQDLQANWIWFVLAGVISQTATVLWAQAYFPAFIEHIRARLPFSEGMGWDVLLPVLAITLIGEELTFRTLIQGRLAPYIGTPVAVVVASALFGAAHVSSSSIPSCTV
jgi:membrane protease YdiL (CAAX protease family)